MNTFEIPKRLHTTWKNLAANCLLLSEIKHSGGPYLENPMFHESHGHIIGSNIAQGFTWVNFVKRLVMTSKNRYPFLVLCKGPRISMQRDASGLAAGNNLSGFVCLRSLSLFFAHVEQLRTVAYISAAM